MTAKTELPSPKRRTRAEVQQLVAEFVSSGMRRRSEFCQSRGLSFSTLDRHLKKLRWKRRRIPTSSAGRLVPVELAAKKSPTQREPSCGLAVVLPGGRRIEVHPDFDTSTPYPASGKRQTIVGRNSCDDRGSAVHGLAFQRTQQGLPVCADALGKAHRFLEHPELELSNNLAENSMRPVALVRKNWLHIGSSQAGPKVAAILSVVESCRRLKLPVREYLAALLPGFAHRPIQRLPDLTPAAWVTQHS